jgi:hypothetical protein
VLDKNSSVLRIADRARYTIYRNAFPDEVGTPSALRQAQGGESRRDRDRIALSSEGVHSSSNV